MKLLQEFINYFKKQGTTYADIGKSIGVSKQYISQMDKDRYQTCELCPKKTEEQYCPKCKEKVGEYLRIKEEIKKESKQNIIKNSNIIN